MRLRALAGAYAGQLRDYSTPVGLAALRSGTAEHLDAVRPLPPAPAPPVLVIETRKKRPVRKGSR